MAEVTVNGVKLSYEVRGEGPPVLLISGTMGQASLWWLGIGSELVGAGYTVIAMDNRGVPPSDVPKPPYTIEDMAGDTIGLMEHLGLGPYAVIGASMGGMITQTVALRRPDLVRAVVLLISGGNLCAYAREYLRAMRDIIEAVGDMPPSVLGFAMLTSMLPPASLQDDASVDNALAMAGLFGNLPPDGMLGQFEADLKWASEDHVTELAGLRVPALAVAHEFDLSFPPATVKEAVAAMPHGEYVEIAGAAHASFDKMTESHEPILSFLARHPTTTVTA